MKKKLVALTLVAAMALTATGCGDSSNQASNAGGSTSTTEAGAEKEYTTVKVSTVTFNNLSSETESVENAINTYIRENTDVPVQIDLDFYDAASYQQQYQMQIGAGEEMDLFWVLGLGDCISKGYVQPITDKVLELCPDAVAEIGEENLAPATYDGEVYAVPVNRGYACHYYFIYRKDMLDAVGVKKEDIKTPEDVENVLLKVKEKYPDMIPLAPLNMNAYYLDAMFTGANGAQVDFLGSGAGFNSAMGCIIGDDFTVQNYYATDVFKETVETAYRWRQEGLLTQDTSVSPDSAPDLLSAGRAFATWGGYANSAESIAKRFSLYGYEMDAVEISTPYIVTTSNAVMWGLASSSKHPDEALQALNLLLTDDTIINYVMYGLEGRDYVLSDDKVASFPDGVDISTVPYTLCSTSGLLNEIRQYTFEGDLASDKEYFVECNNNSAKSPAFGFNFRSDETLSEETACTNVINKYYNMLSNGEADPETTLPQFISELKSAGIDKIIEVKQRDLDAWVAENK